MKFTKWLATFKRERSLIGYLARVMLNERTQWAQAKSKGQLYFADGSEVPALPWKNKFAWLKKHLLRSADGKKKFWALCVAWRYHRDLFGGK